MSEKIKNCCIVGGSGFIGKYVVEALLKTKRNVSVIHLHKNTNNLIPKSVKNIIADCRNKEVMKKALRNTDELIYLACSADPKSSFDNPLKDIVDNLTMGVNCLEAAVESGVKKCVIVSSGGTVYGKTAKITTNENENTNPLSSFGIAKLMLEKYALMLNRQKGLKIVIARPGNAYGEYQKPYRNLGFVINAIARIIDKKEVLMFGKNGTVRDYLHAADIASGIVSCLEKGKSGEIYNIGGGIGRSNKDVLKAIFPLAKSSGFKPKIKIKPLRPFDVPLNILDSGKLTLHTGWVPKISFREGIKRTWKWYLNLKSIDKK
jgi:UDP-glucose 4-epimerase